MDYVEAPDFERPNGRPVLFMAGGITGCPDWQSVMRKTLDASPLGEGVLLANPRRADFPIDDPSAADKQIQWEHEYLQMAEGILFWFPEETLCPIVLFELGRWSKRDSGKDIFVGVHPRYARRQDIDVQMRLERPMLWISHSLDDLAHSVFRGLERWERLGLCGPYP